MQDPGAGGPHQGILVDIGPLNLLGSVPGQDHGSAQHVQVLLQRHSTEEKHDIGAGCLPALLADTRVPTYASGIISRVLGGSPQLQAEPGEGPWQLQNPRVTAPAGNRKGLLGCKQATAHHWLCTGRAGAPLPTMTPPVHLIKKSGRKGAGGCGVGWTRLALPGLALPALAPSMPALPPCPHPVLLCAD